MRMRDRIYQRIFANLFVYNILFEDSEVDERFLGVDDRSTVLGISGAGCRIAGHVSGHPRTIDAVDINRSHLALTALKVAAAQRLPSYSDFYDLFGRGWHPQPEPLLREVTSTLPEWIRKHWKQNHHLFSRSMLRRGLTARVFELMRRETRVDVGWLRSLIPLSLEQRFREIDERFGPALRRPWVRAALASPANLIAVGVNYLQWERILETEQTDFIGFILQLLKRVATTDLERNWFAWFAIAGRFNHDDPEAVPPYLRKDRHDRSLRAPTRARFHNANILHVLETAGPRTWSHYTLCDAPDWMPPEVQKRLLDEVLRTSRDGGVLLYRTVEESSLVERHGLSKHFQLMESETEQATALDRTRQFRRVNYYRICH